MSYRKQISIDRSRIFLKLFLIRFLFWEVYNFMLNSLLSKIPAKNQLIGFCFSLKPFVFIIKSNQMDCRIEHFSNISSKSCDLNRFFLEIKGHHNMLNLIQISCSLRNHEWSTCTIYHFQRTTSKDFLKTRTSMSSHHN